MASGLAPGELDGGRTEYSAVLPYPGPGLVLVVTRGRARVVDRDRDEVREVLADDCEGAWHLPELGLVLLSNGLWFEAFGEGGLAWRTIRLSWGGIRDVVIDGTQLTGEGWNTIDETWQPFRVDLERGLADGGGYEAPCG